MRLLPQTLDFISEFAIGCGESGVMWNLWSNLDNCSGNHFIYKVVETYNLEVSEIKLYHSFIENKTTQKTVF